MQLQSLQNTKNGQTSTQDYHLQLDVLESMHDRFAKHGWSKTETTLTAVQDYYINLSLAPELVYPGSVFLASSNCSANKVPACGIKARGYQLSVSHLHLLSQHTGAVNGTSNWQVHDRRIYDWQMHDRKVQTRHKAANHNDMIFQQGIAVVCVLATDLVATGLRFGDDLLKQHS